ncbi:hypothetical protein [Pedobacter sp. Leaf176]|uniref:hypothetical protein n=1 Tax=Pedobacter sp. Leaf176 TaxID=1736286 RepID=UPI0006FD9641|nr:hypothetical protein [Pedobacter sp. Leaf176]KQR71751.1 hypothetical protein ASF92_00050 [Pedobacter sp. Leaf176]
MIIKNNAAKNNSNPTVLKIKPNKFKELLSAFELNANSITIFTEIADVTIKEKIMYAEKSALEMAFEEFQNHEF